MSPLPPASSKKPSTTSACSTALQSKGSSESKNPTCIFARTTIRSLSSRGVRSKTKSPDSSATSTVLTRPRLKATRDTSSKKFSRKPRTWDSDSTSVRNVSSSSYSPTPTAFPPFRRPTKAGTLTSAQTTWAKTFDATSA